MLTDKEIAAIKSNQDKEQIIQDSPNLYLRISKNGKKTFIFRRLINGKQVKKTIGTYPAMKLKQARERRDFLLTQYNGMFELVRFEDVAEEWFAWYKNRGFAKGTVQVGRSMLDKYLLPALAKKPLVEIRSDDLVRICSEYGSSADKNKHSRSQRILRTFRAVARFGMAKGYIKQDVSVGIIGFMTPVNKGHLPSISDERQFGKLIYELMNGKRDTPHFYTVLLFIAYTAVRVHEALNATWSEFDFDKKIWTISAERMKAKNSHEVPLSPQVIELLKSLPRDGTDSVFIHSLFSYAKNIWRLKKACMAAQSGETTIHGFRKSFSSILHENSWDIDLIELQLAHKRKGVWGIYNVSTRRPERYSMMCWWSDFLDSLGKGTTRPEPLKPIVPYKSIFKKSEAD